MCVQFLSLEKSAYRCVFTLDDVFFLNLNVTTVTRFGVTQNRGIATERTRRDQNASTTAAKETSVCNNHQCSIGHNVRPGKITDVVRLAVGSSLSFHKRHF